jgi:hypothetical protein
MDSIWLNFCMFFWFLDSQDPFCLFWLGSDMGSLLIVEYWPKEKQHVPLSSVYMDIFCKWGSPCPSCLKLILLPVLNSRCTRFVNCLSLRSQQTNKVLHLFYPLPVLPGFPWREREQGKPLGTTDSRCRQWLAASIRQKPIKLVQNYTAKSWGF